VLISVLTFSDCCVGIGLLGGEIVLRLQFLSSFVVTIGILLVLLLVLLLSFLGLIGEDSGDIVVVLLVVMGGDELLFEEIFDEFTLAAEENPK
jgi:hypothetical protein